MPSVPTVIDLRDLGPEFVRDPYPVFARLREQGPVHLVRNMEGHEAWLIVGHDACRAAFTDPRMVRDFRKVDVDLDVVGVRSADSPAVAHMLWSDPPDHTRLRRLVSRAFTQRRIAGLAPRIQEITDDLLDAMLADGADNADLVHALAVPLTTAVICELLGVPELDWPSFRAWSDAVVRHDSVRARVEAYDSMVSYVSDIIDRHRATPNDGLLSALSHTVDKGANRLDDSQLIGMSILLLIAGHHTTVNIIGNGVRALSAHPDQKELLRDDPDGLLDGAIDEILRYDTSVVGQLRWTTEPVHIGDVVVPANATVMIVMATAGRDPSRFAEPDRFDIRRDARGHLAFGHGVHHCLGAPLARLQARIVLRTLIARCPELTVDADEATLPWVPGLEFRGVRSLPVRW